LELCREIVNLERFVRTFIFENNTWSLN